MIKLVANLPDWRSIYTSTAGRRSLANYMPTSALGANETIRFDADAGVVIHRLSFSVSGDRPRMVLLAVDAGLTLDVASYIRTLHQKELNSITLAGEWSRVQEELGVIEATLRGIDAALENLMAYSDRQDSEIRQSILLPIRWPIRLGWIAGVTGLMSVACLAWHETAHNRSTVERLGAAEKQIETLTRQQNSAREELDRLNRRKK